MPRESFSCKRGEQHVRLIRQQQDSRGVRQNDHIDNHDRGSSQDNDRDCHYHTRVGPDFPSLDSAIDHVLSPRRKSRQHSSETDHAFA